MSAPDEKDYKQMVIRQKQGALDMVPLFVLMGGMAVGAAVGAFAGLGIFATLQEEGRYTLSSLILQATSLSAAVGAFAGIAACLFASMLKDAMKKDYEKEFKIKLN